VRIGSPGIIDERIEGLGAEAGFPTQAKIGLEWATRPSRWNRPSWLRPRIVNFSSRSAIVEIMNEHRRQILQMLSQGKVSADEAERLISAMEEPSATKSDLGPKPAGKDRPKYLRVQVDSEDGGGHDGPTKVNVRVPMQLLRAGVKLAYLIPAAALQKANLAMHEKGIPVDLTQIKPDNLEELVEQLSDLTVDVDQKDADTRVKVRVFCE